MATKKKVKPTRWMRLLEAHRERGPWLSSWDQMHAIGSVTISKVRSECRANGYRWLKRDDDGITLYRPVKSWSGAQVQP